MHINHISFNSIGMHITCATDNGYIIYNLTPFEKIIECTELSKGNNGIGLLQQNGKTNILLFVGGGKNPFKSNHILVLWDMKMRRSHLEIDTRDIIRNVLINDKQLISVNDNSINIFDWEGTLIDEIFTFRNESGLCVSGCGGNLIVTLGQASGEIAIIRYEPDNFADRKYSILKAHLTNIEVISVNKSGTLVATASEIGTLIRVFNLETLEIVYEFRRGTQQAGIYDISFSLDSKYLSCCSSNGTVHFFELYKSDAFNKNTKSILSGLKNYLPEYFGSQWSFKQVHLGYNCKTVSSFDMNNNLHILSYDGSYNRISFKGGNMDQEPNIYTNNLYAVSKQS